jgi:hypothetical protein
MSSEKSLHASTSLFLEILKSWPPTKKCPNEGTSFLDKVQITSRVHFTFSFKSWPYKLQSVLMKVRLSWTKLKSLKASTSLFPNILKSWPKKCPMKVRPSWTKSTLQIRNKTNAAINWRHFMFECRTINAANPKARAMIRLTTVKRSISGLSIVVSAPEHLFGNVPIIFVGSANHLLHPQACAKIFMNN